jgi:hypothetical protein
MVTTALNAFFEWLLRASWQASVIAALVLLVQWLFRKRGKATRCGRVYDPTGRTGRVRAAQAGHSEVEQTSRAQKPGKKPKGGHYFEWVSYPSHIRTGAE